MHHSVEVDSKLSAGSLNEDLTLTPELYGQIAAWLVNKGLTVPAIFFLELYKPFCNLAYQAGISIKPILSAVMSDKRANVLLALVKDGDSIERLIVEVERADTASREGAC
ncbi:MAG: hypothetical protein J5J00_07275 [Deltaproteobacteria bacterium]|nr:hypothetical protein [Deltaproteobacteria bacterium]